VLGVGPNVHEEECTDIESLDGSQDGVATDCTPPPKLNVRKGSGTVSGSFRAGVRRPRLPCLGAGGGCVVNADFGSLSTPGTRESG